MGNVQSRKMWAMVEQNLFRALRHVVGVILSTVYRGWTTGGRGEVCVVMRKCTEGGGQAPIRDWDCQDLYLFSVAFGF